MFGKDKKPEVPAGAKEKIRRAKLLWEGRDPNAIDSAGNAKAAGGNESAISVVIIYGMSVALALLLTQGPLAKGAPFMLPDAMLQRWLLGHPVPTVTGNPDTDMLIAVFVRGTAIFLCAGLVPLLAKGISLLDKREKKTPAPLLLWFASALLLSLVYILETI